MCLTDDDDDSAAMTLAAVVYIQGIENGATHSAHTHPIYLAYTSEYTSSQFMYRISLCMWQSFAYVSIQNSVLHTLYISDMRNQNIFQPPHKSCYIHVLCWR